MRKWRKSCGNNTERSYGNNTEKSCGNNTKRDPPHPPDRRPEYSDDTRDKADGYFQPQTFSKGRTWVRRRKNNSILKAFFISQGKIIEASLISQWDFYSRDARPAPAPGEMAAPGRPGPPRPRKFSTLPHPAPPQPGKRGGCPAPKITPGQESRQTFLHHQKFLGVKNF